VAGCSESVSSAKPLHFGRAAGGVLVVRVPRWEIYALNGTVIARGGGLGVPRKYAMQ
jgi:hypothetical protein